MSCCTFDQISQAIHDSGGEIDGRTTKFIKVFVGEDTRDVISYPHILDRLREIFKRLIDLF
jgi:ferritin